MTESELRQRYEDERPIYDAYGAFVKNTLKEEIQEAVDPGEFGKLFKIPPSYRTKEPKSLIEKALYRGKNYDSPYEDGVYSELVEVGSREGVLPRCVAD